MFVKPEVLVICPTAAGRMYLGVLLGRIWYQPLLARTVDEAIHHANRSRFAVQILDGDLPLETFKSAIAVIKTHPLTKTIPLVVFASTTAAPPAETLRALGCECVLPKPVDFSLTYATLARLSGQTRHQARVSLHLEVTLEEQLPEAMLICTNISEGGMFLRTPSPPAAGSVLRIRFTLPQDNQLIKAAATVVHRMQLGTTMEKEPGVGLRFSSLAEQDLARIRLFVQRQILGDLRWS
ncbi:MAG: PilZ domain-containing protein [Nitrospirota bacterium]|nr:PilZ domain-containing protein [Nitrospirota bacterium]